MSFRSGWGESDSTLILYSAHHEFPGNAPALFPGSQRSRAPRMPSLSGYRSLPDIPSQAKDKNESSRYLVNYSFYLNKR